MRISKAAGSARTRRQKPSLRRRQSGAAKDSKGRRILVWDEQGLGDLIQFSRFLSPLAAAGAEVTLLCRKNMQRLLGTSPAPVRLVEALEPGESFDFESALLSLPRGLKDDAGNDTGGGGLPSSGARRRRQMGDANWRGRISHRRLLAWQRLNQSEEERSLKLIRRRRGDRRRAPHQSRQGSIRDRYRDPKRSIFNRESRRRIRLRSRFIHRLRGGDGGARPRHHVGHRIAHLPAPSGGLFSSP